MTFAGVDGAEERVFAIIDRCPHKGGPLSQGIVHGNVVTCPLHNWNISLKSGEALGEDKGCVPTIPLRVDAGRIYLLREAVVGLTDAGGVSVRIDGRPVLLSGKEFALLRWFLLHPNTVHSADGWAFDPDTAEGLAAWFGNQAAIDLRVWICCSMGRPLTGSSCRPATARSKAAAPVTGGWPNSASNAESASGAGSPVVASSRRKTISGPSTRVIAA